MILRGRLAIRFEHVVEKLVEHEVEVIKRSRVMIVRAEQLLMRGSFS